MNHCPANNNSATTIDLNPAELYIVHILPQSASIPDVGNLQGFDKQNCIYLDLALLRNRCSELHRNSATESLSITMTTTIIIA